MEIKASQIFLSVLLVYAGGFLVIASAQKGFLSLDCGGFGGWESVSTLNWTRDSDYLQSSNDLLREKLTMSATTTFGEIRDTLNESENRLSSARIFYPPGCGSTTDPEWFKIYDRQAFTYVYDSWYKPVPASIMANVARVQRSKYCYKLPLEMGDDEDMLPNVLVRATFPAQNWFQTELKICSHDILDLSADTVRFSFYVEGGRPVVIELDAVQARSIEFIVSPPSASHLHVCLAPLGMSVAAISTLEIRPLAQTMKYADQTLFAMTLFRLNFGGDPDTSPIRYPTDEYDRKWTIPAPPVLSSNVGQFVVIGTSDFVNSSGLLNGHEDYGVPAEVMKTAWEGANVLSVITLNFNTSDLITMPHLLPYFGLKVHSYFYDFRRTNSGSSPLSKSIEVDIRSTSGQLTNHSFSLSPGLAVKSVDSFGDISEVNVLIYSNESALVPPFINALEFFLHLDVAKVSLSNEEAALKNLLKLLNLTTVLDTTGAPCTPVPYPWIRCSSNDQNSAVQVTGITLPTMKANGSAGCILPKLLWTGNLSLEHLTDLVLPGDGCFNNNLPASFANLSSLRTLKIFGNTQLGAFPTANLPGKTLRELDLSGNNLWGSLPLGSESLAGLQSLNLSFNQFQGEFQPGVHVPPQLRLISLAYNNLTGTVPDDIWTSPTLEEVYLRGNVFTKLNLTSWVEAVNRTKQLYVGRVKVDLTCNLIDEVFPSVEDLDFEVNYEDINDHDSEGCILLGGNPWCYEYSVDNPKHYTLYNPIKEFLCRLSAGEWMYGGNDTPYYLPKKKPIKTPVLIVLVLSGILVFFLVCIVSFFAWKERRRSIELRQIQEALAKDQVRPPFYSYFDLRFATGGFSSACVLGKGGFGTVFKADLPNGEVLAVKRLNWTEQSTSEFLKEIVNISGIKHKHLIQLKGCCVRDKDHRMLIYEYAENRSLAEALWSPAKTFTLTWNQRISICLGVARGLAYLHEELQPMIVHRDIKPQNILLDEDYCAKIADFGLARPSETMDTQVTAHIGGTRGYLPPEYLIEGLVSEKLDVFSFGVVLLEIVSGRRCLQLAQSGHRSYLPSLASSLHEAGELLSLVDEELAGTYSDGEASLVLEISLACCQLDPKQRPSMSYVVSSLCKHTPVAVSVEDLTRPRRAVEPIAEESEEDFSSFTTLSHE